MFPKSTGGVEKSASDRYQIQFVFIRSGIEFYWVTRMWKRKQVTHMSLIVENEDYSTLDLAAWREKAVWTESDRTMSDHAMWAFLE